MQETKKLFDSDPYGREFEALVLSALPVEGRPPEGQKERKKGRDAADSADSGRGTGGEFSGNLLEVVLDQTLFFPEEGGQTPDRGELDGFPVADVRLDGGLIRHYVRVPREMTAGAGGPPFVPGRTVRGRIDFGHRFSNMQNHTGEHILSGLVHGKFGYDNVGFHLSDNTVTLDFNGELSDDDISWLETAANRVVWENREIRAFYPPEEDLAAIPYRSKKEIDGPLRIVEIEGVDVCACCAPHVRRTGEVGVVKILRSMREKGGIRLTILCGSRALSYLQQLQRAAEEASHLTNLPREEIAAGVLRLLTENERLRQRCAALEATAADAIAAGVPAGKEDVFLFLDDQEAAGADKGRTVGRSQSGGALGGLVGGSARGDVDGRVSGSSAAADIKETCGIKTGNGAASGSTFGGIYFAAHRARLGNPAQRELVNSLCAEHPGCCGVFSGNDEEGYKFIIGAGRSEDGRIHADARILSACLHKDCGARGGGRPEMVQGSVRASREKILESLDRALCGNP